jgi:hypothetical protein
MPSIKKSNHWLVETAVNSVYCETEMGPDMLEFWNCLHIQLIRWHWMKERIQACTLVEIEISVRDRVKCLNSQYQKTLNGKGTYLSVMITPVLFKIHVSQNTKLIKRMGTVRVTTSCHKTRCTYHRGSCSRLNYVKENLLQIAQNLPISQF